MTIEHLVVDIGPHEINYRRAGSGHPVIMLHGSHRSGYVWQSNMVGLAEEFLVFAPDRPGYGASSEIGMDDPLPNMVEVAHEFMLAMGIKNAHWIGESRGGGIAIQLAARYPEAVDKLVLNAPVGLPPDEFPKPPQVGTPWEWFLDRSFEGSSPLIDEIREATLRDLEKAAAYEKRRLESVTPEYNQKGLLEDMVDVAAPVMLTWGRQDPVFPVECIERFRQLLPTLEEVLIIDDSRHLAFMEHADIFNAAVARFLKRDGDGADSR